MKNINNQLYGLETEMDSASETNGTTCFCVDTGTVFVAYGGIWYEQRNVYWKSGGVSASDLSGYARYIPPAESVADLTCFNAMDTGDRYVAYLGHWFKQPVPWFTPIDGESEQILGTQTVATAAVTERVEGGTLLKNPLWTGMVMAPVGYFYDTAENKLRFYFVFSTPPGVCDHFVTYRMTEKNSQNDPYEFTIENAPSLATVSSDDVFKYRVNLTISDDPTVFDIRCARILYDAADNEIARIYSAQYRYTVSDGVATRTLVPTAKQDGSYIIDLGLSAAENTVRHTFNFVKNNVGALLPLVHTNQESGYSWIIPDELFEGKQYGLSVVAAAGDGLFYVGPTFDKAEDDTFIVTLTPTAQDLSGTMDKTVAEINAAYEAGQKIVFKVMENATNYMMVDCSAQYFNEHVYPSFNAYIIMPGVGIVFAATGTQDNGTFNEYVTTIYPLTPMS